MPADGDEASKRGGTVYSSSTRSRVCWALRPACHMRDAFPARAPQLLQLVIWASLAPQFLRFQLPRLPSVQAPRLLPGGGHGYSRCCSRHLVS